MICYPTSYDFMVIREELTALAYTLNTPEKVDYAMAYKGPITGRDTLAKYLVRKRIQSFFSSLQGLHKFNCSPRKFSDELFGSLQKIMVALGDPVSCSACAYAIDKKNPDTDGLNLITKGKVDYFYGRFSELIVDFASAIETYAEDRERAKVSDDIF